MPALPLGDQRLRQSFDAAILQMNTGGQLATLMAKTVRLGPRYVLLPALPYRDPARRDDLHDQKQTALLVGMKP